MLFENRLPSNLDYFYQLTLGAFKFDVYNTQEVTEKFLAINDEDDPFSERFGDFGYGSKSLILNIDTLFYMYLAYPFGVVLALILLLLSNHRM